MVVKLLYRFRKLSQGFLIVFAVLMMGSNQLWVAQKYQLFGIAFAASRLVCWKYS